MKATRGSTHRAQIVFGIVATLILTGLSVLAVGALGGGVDRGDDELPFGSACTVPNLSGTVVTVSLTDMGGAMDGQHNRMTSGTTMFLSADHTTAPHGTVSFLAVNGGRLIHELMVLPLPEGKSVRTRPIGGDLKIAETDSVGEASTPCGEGAGRGILPGSSSWVTLTLAPGRYELVCNLPGHYAAGMYAEFMVT
jgi:uncharacterized cupredoxin-like copper-binding protein